MSDNNKEEVKQGTVMSKLVNNRLFRLLTMPFRVFSKWFNAEEPLKCFVESDFKMPDNSATISVATIVGKVHLILKSLNEGKGLSDEIKTRRMRLGGSDSLTVTDSICSQGISEDTVFISASVNSKPWLGVFHFKENEWKFYELSEVSCTGKFDELKQDDLTDSIKSLREVINTFAEPPVPEFSYEQVYTKGKSWQARINANKTGRYFGIVAALYLITAYGTTIMNYSGNGGIVRTIAAPIEYTKIHTLPALFPDIFKDESHLSKARKQVTWDNFNVTASFGDATSIKDIKEAVGMIKDSLNAGTGLSKEFEYGTMKINAEGKIPLADLIYTQKVSEDTIFIAGAVKSGRSARPWLAVFHRLPKAEKGATKWELFELGEVSHTGSFKSARQDRLPISMNKFREATGLASVVKQGE